MRRPLAWFVTVGLVASVLGGCGGRSATGDVPGAGATTPSRAGIATTSSGVPAPAPSTATRAMAPGPSPRPGSSTTAAVASRAAGPTTTADPGGAERDPEPGPPDDGSAGSPGSFARTMLRPAPATRIVVERQQQPGVGPSPAALDHLRTTLGRVTAKDVAITAPVALDAGARDWSAGELAATADRSAAVARGGGVAVVRLLFVRGTFEGDDTVLAVAARGDVVAVFGEAIAAAATPLVSGLAIEEAVLVHEFGHLLGLVDLARDTGRADQDHPGHSTNRRSVMYWAIESSLIARILGGPPPRDFDAADEADLDALRGGA